MRKILTISIVLFVSVLFSFAKDTSVDWLFLYPQNSQYDYWLMNNDSAALVYCGIRDNKTNKYSSYFQFWDLNKHQLLKKVQNDSLESLEGIMFSEKNRELVYFHYDYIAFINIDVPNSKIVLHTDMPSGYYSNNCWYDSKTDKYIITYPHADSIYFCTIDPINKNQTGKFVYVCSNEPNQYTYSCSGGKIVFLEDTNKIKILSTDTFTAIDSILTKGGISALMTLSPSGKYLGYSTHSADTAKLLIYNLENSTIELKPNIIDDDFYKLIFSKDEQLFIIPYYNSGNRVYSIHNPNQIKVINAKMNMGRMNFCLNDECVIDIETFAIVRAVDWRADTLRGIFAEPDQIGYDGMDEIKADESRNVFYSIGSKGILSERSLNDGKVLKYFPIGVEDFTFAKINFQDTLVLFSRHNILLWDINKEQILDSIPINIETLYKAKISNDLRWVVTPQNNGIGLFDTKNKIKYTIDSERTVSLALDFSSDSKLLAEGGSDNVLKIFDLTKIAHDTTPILTIKTNDYSKYKDQYKIGLNLAQFIKNDSEIITSSRSDSLFKIWDVSTGDRIQHGFLPDSILQLSYSGHSYIENIYYRKEFDDYFTVDGYDLIFWNKDLDFKQSLPISPIYINDDIIDKYDYLQQTNKLIEGTVFKNSVMLISLNDEHLAVNEPFNDNQSILYPNPAHDELWINIPNGGVQQRIEIVNLLGETVLSEPFTSHVSVVNLSSGVYFVRIGEKMYPFVKN